ncbi:MAG: hypothetical protein RL885_12335 [Planctomycetota bacterium]
MSFQQTVDLFRRSERWHHRASDLFAELAERVTQPKAKMLLEFLCEREQQIAAGIRERRQGLSPQAASTWFQYTPDDQITRSIDALGLTEDISLDELIERALALFLEFEHLYADLAQLASHREVQAAFRDLQSYADIEGHKFVKNAAEFSSDT